MSEQPASAIWTTRPATSSGSAVVPQSNGMKMPMPPPPEPKKKLAFPSTVGVRQEMRTFFYPTFKEPAVQTAALQRRDLFILAFMRWKSLPKEDIDSYVQIAGVHGRPMSIGYGVDAPLTETELVAAATVEGTPRAFVTPLTKLKYNDRPGPGDGEVQFSNMGVAEFAYCKHGRPTFMTWHRPFMYLAERAIRKCAKYLVENGLIRGDLNAAKKQVELIRIPYWNWCIDAPVPDVLLADTIALTQFAMDGQGTSGVSSDLIEGHMSDPNITGRPHESIVPNPFKSFNPTAQQFEYFNGEVPGPEKFNQPQGIPGTLTDYDSNCVFGPDGTLRQPGWSSYLANHLVKTLRKNVGMGCMYKDFIAPNGDVQQSSSHWFEAAHNALHNVFSMAIAPDHGRPTAQRSPWTKTGTNPGVVTVMGRSAMLNDCSTFDPAFFFHHCFVDCQLSMQRAAYPAGEFIPQIKNPEKSKKDPNTSYYPDVDPVPTDDKDLRTEFGQNRQWLTSAFHPWSTGLFSELFGGDDLSRERQKLQQQADAKAAAKDNGQTIPEDTYVPQYVDSSDTEHCEQWGVTYQMLLTEKAQRSGDVELSYKDRSAWMMSAKEAQAKFIFDFTEDPFLRLVHELSQDLGTNFPWPTEDIPPKQLRRLIEAATPMTWTLNMKLPKFFKVADGFAVGRSWTLNVYWWDKSSTLPVSRDARLSTVTPRDPSFAGSASVFAPFDLRACLNCQADNMVLPVSVDLTDIIVRRYATHLSDDEILAQIDLQAVGVPADMLPPYNTWRDYFKATLVKRPAMTVEGLEKGSVPQVLLTWKNELAKLVKTNPPKSNSISDVSPTTSMLTQLQQIWSTFQSSHPNELEQVVSLLGHRTKPIHAFRIAATGTGIGIGIGDNTNKSAKRVNESMEEDGQGPAKKSKKSH